MKFVGIVEQYHEALMQEIQFVSQGTVVSQSFADYSIQLRSFILKQLHEQNHNRNNGDGERGANRVVQKGYKRMGKDTLLEREHKEAGEYIYIYIYRVLRIAFFS